MQDFQAAVAVLDQLRSLSGRLALKLISAPSQRAEALGLALSRMYLEHQGAFLSQIAVPLDAHLELYRALKQVADERLRAAKNLSDWLDGAIALKYGDQAQEARRAEGKDTGTVRLQDGQVSVVAELPKRVDWDQAMLAGLVERIRADGADPTEYVDIALSVSERKYTAWPKDIRQEFEPARTVRTAKPRFRLLLGEEVR